MEPASGIAYLGTYYPSSISPAGMRSEVEELRSRGIDVAEFSFRVPSPEKIQGEFAEAAVARTHYLFRSNVGLLFRGLTGLASIAWPRIENALRIIQQTGPTGLKARVRQGAYLLQAAALTRQLRILRVRHLHAHGGESCAFVAALASALSGLPHSLAIHGPDTFDRPSYWALGSRIAGASFVACISEFCRDQCKASSSVADHEKLHVVRSCPPRALTLERPVAVPSSGRLVFIGRLVPDKGLFVLLEAAKQLIAEGRVLELRIIGDGRLRQSVQAFVEREGLQATVQLMGWRSPLEIAQELSSARALVLPSFAEGLPVVIMEAFSLFRPVIATNIAAVAELVEPGRSGWLVEPGDVSGLARSIDDVLDSSPERLLEMGARGSSKVKAQHNPANEVTHLLNLIESAPAEGLGRELRCRNKSERRRSAASAIRP